MSEPYQRPVARIRHKDDETVVGAGFLAPRGVVISCAHVVNNALGRDELSKHRPTDSDIIPLDTPWAARGRFHGRVIDWRPPIEVASRQGEACADIAVLKLIEDYPASENAVPPQSPIA